MVLSIKHAALALAVSMGALAGACGPATPAPDGPPSGGAVPPGEEAPPAPGEATPGEATSPEGDAPKPAEPEAAAPAKSRDLTATAMEADLKKIGLNLQKLPELEKLTLAQKKKVMPLLQKSLGMESCQGCHVEGDFTKETRDMKVAREMWRHFVVPLRTEQGGAVFCDSCHGGQEHVLARADKKAVEAFMEDQYEHKLTRADKSDMECSTCHGDAMELQIIEKLWKIPKG